MNKSVFAALGVVVAVSLPGVAAAACTAGGSVTRVDTELALRTLLNGNTVCVPASPGPGWEWQEQHRAAGQLWDYKLGPGHAVDPEGPVGTWSVGTGRTGGVVVTHSYGGTSYSFQVFNNGNGTHSFCNPNTSPPEIVATIKTGIGGCP